MMNEFTKFLMRLKIYRAGKGFTQQEVAKRLGLSLRTYQRIEQGTAPIELEKVYSLCEILEITYKELTEPGFDHLPTASIEFFDTLHSISKVANQEGYNLPLEELQNLTLSFEDFLVNHKMSVNGLSKTSEFLDNPHGFYYSNLSFSWLNPALVKRFNPSSSLKVPVVKDAESLENIIYLLELSLESKKNWYLCKYDLSNSQGKSTAHTVCNFRLYGGLPFIIGHIYHLEVR